MMNRLLPKSITTTSTLVPKILGWLCVAVIMLALPCILLVFIGYNPSQVVLTLVREAVGNRGSIAQSLDKATPIIFAAMGATVAFRCGVWNIGIQGQVLMGALGAGIAGLYLNLPLPLHLLACALLAMILGGSWATIAGFLRQKMKVTELVTTLLLNYIAYWFIFYLVRFPMLGKYAFGPTTDTLPRSARLPGLTPTGAWSSLTIDFFLAVVIVLGVWYLF